MQEKINHFWWFCAERESIRLKKESNAPRPWTQDAILNTHKFTNINRIHDRGTQLLIELCKKHDTFNQFCASAIYRFSGSNNSLIEMMRKNKPSDWFNCLSTIKPLFNMRAYQSGWPKGTGVGITFLTTLLQGFCKNVYNELTDALAAKQQILHKTSMLDIGHAKDIMCAELRALQYRAMGFQSTEIAKDLSIFTNIVNPNSACPMNTGAIKGLKYIFNSAHIKNVRVLITDPANPQYNEQILEHALCEYSKYQDFCIGIRKPHQKVYTPTIIRYNTFNNLFINNQPRRQ